MTIVKKGIRYYSNNNEYSLNIPLVNVMSENKSTHGIKFIEKIGYALGDAGGVMSFSLVSSYLQMFYTENLHIPLKKISRLMLIARLWDAINDPMWGAFIDSRKPTKHGRFRPYIFAASFALAIAAVLMFTQLPGLTTSQYLLFAYITYIIYGMAYTCVNIPYGSLASAITDDGIERSSLSMWRSVGAGIGGLPAQILLPLLVFTSVTNAAGDTVKVLSSSKLFVCVLCIAVVSIFVFSAHFKLTKERVAPNKKQLNQNYSVKKAIANLLSNKPFLMLCLVSMLLIAFQMYTQTNYNYLFKDYYGKPGLYSLVTVCTYLPMALFLPSMGKLVRRFGKKEICCTGLLFAAVVNLIMYLIGFTSLSSSPYIFLVLVFFSGMGQTFLIMEIWALVMDVIDYHELISGRREEGTSYSVYSFVRKLGQTAAGSGCAALLDVIGYNVDATATDSIVQTPQVLEKLYDITTLIPAIILFVMFIILTFGYKLSKSKLESLSKQLEEARKDEAQ